MPLKHQYLGFLNSDSILPKETAKTLNIIPFDFMQLSKLPFEINDKEKIGIRENEVLGKRIEHFFKDCIQHSNQYQLLANNIQIFKDKITIGELDFIVKDLLRNKVLHIELVYKFYLYDPSISNELERWIGPNRKDTLVQKLEKIKTKQLPLLFKDETKILLAALHIETTYIEQQVCYLANLFLPLSINKESITQINRDCIVGYWLKYQDLFSITYTSNLFNIPEKQDWVVDPKYCDNWFSLEEIQEEIRILHTKKKSPLIWMKSGENSFERFFLVWW